MCIYQTICPFNIGTTITVYNTITQYVARVVISGIVVAPSIWTTPSCWFTQYICLTFVRVPYIRPHVSMVLGLKSGFMNQARFTDAMSRTLMECIKRLPRTLLELNSWWTQRAHIRGRIKVYFPNKNDTSYSQ